MKPLRLLKVLFLIFFTFSFFVGCEEEDEMPVEDELTLNFDFVRVLVNSEIKLTPGYGSVTLPQKDYRWSVSDTTIIRVEKDAKTNAGIVTGLSEGEAVATLISTDGALQASTTIKTDLLRETEVDLPNAFTAYTQAEVELIPEFNITGNPTRTYTWTSEPEGFVSITADPETYTATVQGLEVGTTVLTLSSEDGEVSASTEVTVEDENDGILKILAIGNSFSENALESYLYALANAAGEAIVIGNMYIGGAELSQHADNVANNAEAYSYRKIDLNGNKTTTPNVSISTAIADENWDYISFQQASPKSGLYQTFVEPLPTLYQEANNQVDNPDTKYLLHKTWAYAQNSTHSGFANYNNDQMTMFQAIVDAYNQADDLMPTDMVIPAGTGIQNGRTSYLGDNFTSDGYHLNDMGKFIASCVWFEKLFGEDVTNTTFVPDGFIPFNADLAKHAAHFAVVSPDAITVLTDYQDAGGSGVLAAPVFIDFSTSSSSDGWNGMAGFLEGTSIPNLLDVNDAFTGITATVTERFNGQNPNGAENTNTELAMPSEVSQNSYFGNANQEWSGMIIETSTVELSGFTTSDTYKLCFFGSRMNVSDNRETQFTVTGSTVQTVTLDTANNTDNVACVLGVQPDTNGNIQIEVTAGPNNTNSHGFFYLSAMSIDPE